MYFPVYLALLFSKLFLVPLIGNLIINALFLFIVTKLICKRFDKKFFFVKLGVSYRVALYASIVSVVVSYLSDVIWKGNIINYGFTGEVGGGSPGNPLGFKLDFLNYLFGILGDTKQAAIFVDKYYYLIFMIAGFALAVIVIFIYNFLSCSDFLHRNSPLKISQKLFISISLTLLNAPWLLFVPVDFLKLIGDHRFYPVI